MVLKPKMLPAAFIQMFAPAAQEVMKRTGVPASFTIAQSAVESAWMGSELAQIAFNLFGIKADPSWKGAAINFPTGEVINGKKTVIYANFRKYPDLATGLHDHADFLTKNPRYQPAFAHCNDAEAFTIAVANAGYATATNYAAMINSIIREHNLTQFDK